MDTLIRTFLTISPTHQMILYQLLYCALSFCGLRWNSFYFSLHLLDLVMNFKLLRTVLRSVLHNGKQLAMTVLMTCVVIYIYTVIAFNFFRKFYHQTSPDGLQVQTCDSMFRVSGYYGDTHTHTHTHTYWQRESLTMYIPGRFRPGYQIAYLIKIVCTQSLIKESNQHPVINLMFV